MKVFAVMWCVLAVGACGDDKSAPSSDAATTTDCADLGTACAAAAVSDLADLFDQVTLDACQATSGEGDAAACRNADCAEECEQPIPPAQEAGLAGCWQDENLGARTLSFTATQTVKDYVWNDGVEMANGQFEVHDGVGSTDVMSLYTFPDQGHALCFKVRVRGADLFLSNRVYITSGESCTAQTFSFDQDVVIAVNDRASRWLRTSTQPCP